MRTLSRIFVGNPSTYADSIFPDPHSLAGDGRQQVGSGGGRSRGLRGGRARQYGDRWRVVRVASARPVGRCAAGWSFPVFVCVREWCGLANLP